MLKKSLASIFTIAGLAAATLAVTARADAQVRVDAFRGHDGPVYRFAGEDYCWYDTAWRGSGWYLCGDQWRRGFGWGGRYGWHGWLTRPPRHHPHGPIHHPGHPRPPVAGQPGKPPVGNPPHHPGGGQPGRPPGGPHTGPRGPR
jgi:hypothetical protein